MDLNSIVLEEITQEQFQNISFFWNKDIRMRNDDTYSQIVKPIIYEDYKQLIHEFVDAEYADEIAVFIDPKWWIKQYVRRITDKEIEKMAEIAKKDPHKRNYLELKFTEDSYLKLDRLELSFTECNEKIIGYDINIPFSMIGLFNTVPVHNPKNHYRYNKALWLPSEDEREAF